MIGLINRVAAACDRSLPPEVAIPLRLKAFIAELGGLGIDTEEMREKEQLLIAAIVSGGRIHDDLSITFEGTVSSL